MANNNSSWDGPSSYSYDNTWDPSGYSGSDFDFGGLSALNDSSWYSPAFDTWAGDTGYSETGLEPTNYAGDSGELAPLNDSQWYSNGSWLDGLSGGLERGVGMLGSVWDKLNAGSGANGAGPSLLSQLGTLGVGGLSAYANYDAYRDANDIAKKKMAQDYAIRQADLELNRDKFGFSKEVSAQDYGLKQAELELNRDKFGFSKEVSAQNYGLRQAELGLSRDASMLSQQSARVGAADNLSKTNAIFDLIKQRQGVDLSRNLKPYTDQLSAQGWTPNYGLAPVTSTLGQFGTTSRPEVPAPLSNTQLTGASFAQSPAQAHAFANGGQATGGGQQPMGALGLLVGSAAGQEDNKNAHLSDGEYVIDADVVAALGDGNTLAGAKKLDQMRENIRQHKRSAPKGKIPPKARSVDAYLKGGR